MPIFDNLKINGIPASDEEAKRVIAREMAGLNPRERNEVLHNLQNQIDSQMKSKWHVEDKLTAARTIKEWLDKPTTLDINSCSRFHDLIEAVRSRKILCMDEEEIGTSANLGSVFSHVFVVKHDWKAAFGESIDDVSAEWKQPYDCCVFEFVISGLPVTVLAMSEEVTKNAKERAVAFIKANGIWATLGAAVSINHEKMVFAWEQVRAICIALDAEVAVTTVERAPLKLNEKRQQAGKELLRDFNVVDLSRRHRVIGAPGGHTGRKVRLHFRRGHWRHFEEHKTWIKWMLVGNPDLGFIGKRYAL